MTLGDVIARSGSDEAISAESSLAVGNRRGGGHAAPDDPRPDPGARPGARHERIGFLSSCYDFPFDTTRALEFALFRTFCAPRIASLLDRTGEFRARPQKRYDDTDIIVSEMMEYGYSSERGSRALARMNAQHGRFRIANDDFRYVLSTFIYEPIRWNARFGWRAMCESERLAYFHFWRVLARGRRAHGDQGHSRRLRRFRALQYRLRKAPFPPH